jgi:histone deacetylase 8
LRDYILLLGGAALQSASLLSRPSDLVIHWDGGRHHALRSSASGYCYLADIPLAIQSLLGKYKSVLYVDLDVHHGDGVEYAFAHTEKVITLSFHVFEPGFFPGTGSGEERGRGVYNVPMKRDTRARVWEEIVKRGVKMVWGKYEPECLVLQCGCDGRSCSTSNAGLLTDPHRGMQLTTYSFQRVVEFILNLGRVPTLVLGGGGYHPPSTAKHFALLTGIILDKELDDEIPLDAQYWEELEKDGGIHVGRDTKMPSDGTDEIERLCVALQRKLEKH